SLTYHEAPVMPPLEIGARADEHIQPDMEGVLVQHQHAGEAVPVYRQRDDPAQRMECSDGRHAGGEAGVLSFQVQAASGKCGLPKRSMPLSSALGQLTHSKFGMV